MSVQLYPKYPLQVELQVENLFTFYYFELPRTYTTVQNELDFWTMSYMIKGEMQVFFEGNEKLLKQGDIIFYKPYTRYWGKTSTNPPNVMIISFDCSSPGMVHLENQTFPLLNGEKQIVSTLLNEAYASLELLTQDCIVLRKQDAPYAGEQLIKNYLEILLLQLIRRRSPAAQDQQPSDGNSSDNRNNSLLADILNYMRERLSLPLTVEQLCKHFGIGKAQLSSSFKAKTGFGVMEYFKMLKTEEAKRLIRENNLTITEISDSLGYNNVQYFSKQFKRLTGMKPTEYAKTVEISFGRGLSSSAAIYSDPFANSAK